MYKILESYTDKENNVELRLARLSYGYTVGIFDLDEHKYYSPIRLYDDNKSFGKTKKSALTAAKEKFAKEKENYEKNIKS